MDAYERATEIFNNSVHIGRDLEMYTRNRLITLNIYKNFSNYKSLEITCNNGDHNLYHARNHTLYNYIKDTYPDIEKQFKQFLARIILEE